MILQFFYSKSRKKLVGVISLFKLNSDEMATFVNEIQKTERGDQTI